MPQRGYSLRVPARGEEDFAAKIMNVVIIGRSLFRHGEFLQHTRVIDLLLVEQWTAQSLRCSIGSSGLCRASCRNVSVARLRFPQVAVGLGELRIGFELVGECFG